MQTVEQHRFPLAGQPVRYIMRLNGLESLIDSARAIW